MFSQEFLHPVKRLLKLHIDLGKAMCEPQDLALGRGGGKGVDRHYRAEVKEPYTTVHLLVKGTELTDSGHIRDALEPGLVEPHAGHGVVGARNAQLADLGVVLDHREPVGWRRGQVIGILDGVLIAFGEEEGDIERLLVEGDFWVVTTAHQCRSQDGPNEKGEVLFHFLSVISGLYTIVQNRISEADAMITILHDPLLECKVTFFILYWRSFHYEKP